MSDHFEIGTASGAASVDTEEMLRASAVLAGTHASLAQLERRTRGAAAGASPRMAGRLHEAADRLVAAGRQAERAADGLRVAAERYGTTEQAIARVQQTAFATAAAVEGRLLRITPIPVLMADLGASVAFLAGETIGHWLRTGDVAPQSDPEVVRWLQLRLSSLDDALRGFVGVETTRDLVIDDPSAPFGTQAIGAAIAAVLWPTAHQVRVRRTVSAPATRPTSFAELGARLPKGSEPAGQVRIERYEDAAGPRWIVYSAGTVTFDVRSGDEPFDLESDVRGVADSPAEAQRAVLQAMHEAGIGADDPVLLVGHSQGALNAMRIAEDGPYAVTGVVQFGGPTEQIAAPPGTAVLQVTHAQDLVPALGGVAAVGGAGTVAVRRTLPDRAVRPVYGTCDPIDAFPAHQMRNYRDTVARAEAAGSPQLEALRRRWAGFFEGDAGESTRYQARRLAPPVVRPPDRCRTADAAPDRPASR